MAKIKLAAVRVQIGMTQRELAKEFNITPQTVCNWEAGVSEPSASQLQRLSQMSGISADDILCGKT